MHLIEKLSNNFAKKISTELNYDNEKQEVIAYGTHALLQMLFSILLVVIFGLIFGVLVEALIVSFSTSILRKYSGGVHATSPAICLIIGTVACIGFGLLSRVALLNQLYFAVAFLAVVYILGFVVFSRLAPVESPNKPISDRRKVKMKKGSLILLGIYCLIAAGLITGYVLSGNTDFLAYAFCLNIGALWQVFTLTKAGEVILGGIDRALNKFLKFI